MIKGMHETKTEKVLFGIVAAVIAGVGALFVEAFDFGFWNSGWVEADSLGEYIQKVWFIPVGVAVIALGIGIWRGSDALDFAFDCWKD